MTDPIFHDDPIKEAEIQKAIDDEIDCMATWVKDDVCVTYIRTGDRTIRVGLILPEGNYKIFYMNV